MRKTELLAAQKAGKTVAYGRYGDLGDVACQEVRVIDVDAIRTVYSGDRFRGYAAKGVEIEGVAKDGSAGKRKVVAAVHLKGTWEDHLVCQAAKENRKSAADQRLADTRATAEAAIASISRLLPDAGYDAVALADNAQSWGRKYTPATAYYVKLSANAAAALVALVKED